MSARSAVPSLIASLPIRAASLLDERVADVADCDRDGDRHAALAGRAVAGADQRVGGLVEIRVGHHDEMVLRAAERLHALAVLRAVRVDVLGDRRRADEAHRRDVRVLEQRVDRLASPCTTLSTPAGRPARSSSSASSSDGLGSRSLGLSTNVLPHAIATGNIHSGTIAGKLNGVMPAHTPSGWRSDQLSMPPPTLSL